MAIRRADWKIGEIKSGVTESLQRPHTDADLFQRGRNPRRHLASQKDVSDSSHFSGIYSFESRLDTIDPDIHRVTCRIDAIADLDDAGDPPNAVGDLLGRSKKHIGRSPKSLTSIGCGTAVRSPIKSSISCAISTSSPGTSCSMRLRTSLITGKIGRRADRLELDEKVALIGLIEVATETEAGSA